MVIFLFLGKNLQNNQNIISVTFIYGNIITHIKHCIGNNIIFAISFDNAE